MSKSKSLNELDYQRQQEQVAEAREANETLLTNTRLTWWTLIVSIVVGLFSMISALADITQLYVQKP